MLVVMLLVIKLGRSSERGKMKSPLGVMCFSSLLVSQVAPWTGKRHDAYDG